MKLETISTHHEARTLGTHKHPVGYGVRVAQHARHVVQKGCSRLLCSWPKHSGVVVGYHYTQSMEGSDGIFSLVTRGGSGLSPSVGYLFFGGRECCNAGNYCRLDGLFLGLPVTDDAIPVTFDLDCLDTENLVDHPAL